MGRTHAHLVEICRMYATKAKAANWKNKSLSAAVASEL
jgi:hypothetical protein